MTRHPAAVVAGGGFAQAAIRGSLWTASQVMLNKVVAAGATLFLGFLLSPDDFGVAGFSLSAATLVSFVNVHAFGDILLARPRLLNELSGSVRRLARVVGGAQAIVILIAGLVLALVYPDRPWLFGLMAIAACRPLFESLAVVPLSLLRASLQYRRISSIDGMTALVASAASVALALFGGGPAAVVAPPIVAIGMRALLYERSSTAFVREAGTARFGRLVLGRCALAGFGSYVAGVLFALEIMLLGVFLPDRSVGLFMFAFGLATQVNSMVSFQIAGALQPIFGHIGEDRERQLDGISRACRMLSAILVPALAVQAGVGAAFIRVAWGGRWDDAAPIFVILSIGQALYVCQWPAAFVLKSQGRFRDYLRLQIANITAASVAYVLVILACERTSFSTKWPLSAYAHPDAVAPLAVAACSAILAAIFCPMLLLSAGRPSGMRLALALDIGWRPWVVALPVALCAAWASDWLAHAAFRSSIWQAIAIAAVGGSAAVTGIAGSLILSRSTREDFRSLIAVIASRSRWRT